MEEKQLHILTSREFWQLSPEEKMTLQGWFENEDEYNQLRTLFLGVDRLKTEFIGAENPSSKVQLDRLFMEVYSNRSASGFKDFLYQRGKMFYMQPIFQIGLAASVIIGLFIFSPTQKIDNQTASHPTKSKKTVLKTKNVPVQTTQPKANSVSQLSEPTTVVASVESGLVDERRVSGIQEDVSYESVASVEMLDEEKPVIMGGLAEKANELTIDQTLAFASAPATTTVTTGATTYFSPKPTTYNWTATETKNSADKSGKKLESNDAFAKDFDSNDLPLTAPSAAERSEILEGLFTTF